MHSRFRNRTPLYVLLLAILFAGLWATTFSGTAEAKGERIPAEELKQMSRLSFTLKDAYQTQYTVYIFAKNEDSTILSEEDYWTGNQIGDVNYTGTYQAALVKKGTSYGIVQSVNLDLHSITMPQTWHYTVKSKDAGTPDMLVITEWGSSNFNLAKTFIIRSGELQRLKFVDHKGKQMENGYGYPAGRDEGIRMLSDAQVQFRFYNNTVFKYEVSTFKLNVSQSKLHLTESRYVNIDQPGWPNSGIGDHAYLESLKSAAKQGILPGQPGIKLGMKHSALQSLLKKARSRENGEWGGYYIYPHYAIGFTDYVHELNKNSRIMVFNLFVEERNLYPDTVKFWLGKPQYEGFNEAEGGYDMIYKFGNRTLSFHYADEFEDQIYLATIY